jgi:FixJ family two-component response regulator
VSDLTASDASWTDILRLPFRSPVPVNLIVVSPVFDIALCVAAMESGAYDVIVPPLRDEDLACVIHRAMEDASSRREARRCASAIA